MRFDPERFRRDPAAFVATLVNPETGQPFELLPAQEAFVRELFTPGPDGRLRYSEAVFSAPKKSGKSTFAALATLYTLLVWGGRLAEGYCFANDFEQARGRVFETIRRIVEATPLLSRLARITADRIEFAPTGAFVEAMPSEYAGAAGANPTVTVFDELWAFSTERAQRLWDETVPVPTRAVSLRLVVSYAGFESEPGPLRELYDRAVVNGERISDKWPLYRAGRLLVFWSHEPIAPWQTPEWLQEMRDTLRPQAYLRLIENRWVTGEEAFVPVEWWDRAAEGGRPMVASDLPTVLAVDAGLKRDSAAVVACAYEPETGKVRLLAHRVFVPTGGEALDIEATLEATIREFTRRFRVVEVRYDPWQFQRSAQTLAREGIPMAEFSQTVPNITAMSTNLYELLRGGNLLAYPADEIRQAVLHAVAVETSRGLKIAKEKATHRIDVLVALAMAALGATELARRYGILTPEQRRAAEILRSARVYVPPWEADTPFSGDDEFPPVMGIRRVPADSLEFIRHLPAGTVTTFEGRTVRVLGNHNVEVIGDGDEEAA